MKQQRYSVKSVAWAAVALGALAGCGGDPNQNSMLAAGSPYPAPVLPPRAPSYPTGLHVAGNQIQDGSGTPIVIHGANRSGTEYECVHTATTIFDGPFDESSVKAIASWHLNAVRVPLNESCWLGLNGAPAATSGAMYKKAISDYVVLLHEYALIPILELHWVAPGTDLATAQQPMPDADHAPAFWTDVATTFANDSGVIFEPYNEPYPDNNKDTAAGWTCWRDGCTADENGGSAGSYQTTGMQALVSAIRAAGATNVVLLGGLEYSNALTQWLAYAPADPTGNLGAAWHIYSNNACAAETCWDMAPEMVALSVPVVATEIGEGDCEDGFITPLMSWLDGQSIGYLAWSWNAFGACVPGTMGSHGSPWSLIANYDSAVPDSVYANTFYTHVSGAPSAQ